MSGREDGFIDESFSHNKYPHISKVLAAIESVGITDDYKKLAGICSAPSLFYSYGIFCSEERMTKHNADVIAQYLEFKFKLHYFHPCIYHIKKVLKTYSGVEFKDASYVEAFVKAFDEFVSKFNKLCFEETGHYYKHE